MGGRQTFHLFLNLYGSPDQSPSEGEYQKKVVEFNEARRREAHQQYVSAVRERINFASNVTPRPSDDLREEERIVIFRRLIRQLMGTESEDSQGQAPHVTSELIRSIFDVDRILYYVAPDWWMPRLIYRQQLATPGGIPRTSTPTSPARSVTGSELLMMRRDDGDGPRDGNDPIDGDDSCPPMHRKNAFTGLCEPILRGGEGESGPRGPIGWPRPFPPPKPPGPPSPTDGTGDREANPPTPLTEGDSIGWGGIRQKHRNNYLITEDSEPAPLGASIGWLIQLDGDNHRNAFLNSPWIKAVGPIRPGKEHGALEWLKKRGVEGVEGLDSEYDGPGVELCDPGERDGGVPTIECVINGLAKKIKQQNTDINNTIATETVFERGFDPLEGGFRAPSKPFEIFDQWIEILPTDQTVATEYKRNGIT